MPEPETPITAGEVRKKIRELRAFLDDIEKRIEGIPDGKLVPPSTGPARGPIIITPPIPGFCFAPSPDQPGKR